MKPLTAPLNIRWPSIHWRLLPLTLLAIATVGSLVGANSIALAQDTAVELGEREDLPASIYTFNTNLLTATAFQGKSYGGTEFQQAIGELRPQGLRFPGGTIANNYLWKEDSFSAPTNDKTKWASQQLHLFRKIGRPYDLPGFARTCKQFGLEPIWVLNIYEETPESVIELMKKLDGLGLNVTKIELANEPYWDGRSLMNVNNYIRFCQPLAETLKRERPDVQIGACFGPVTHGNYNENWNASLAKQDWYDAIVYHEYYGGQGIALEKGEKIPVEKVLHPEVMFDEPVRVFSQLLPGKPIWYTEWNIGTEGLKQWKNTGAELLYLAASISSLVEHHEAIPLACFHQIHGTGFGTFEIPKDTGGIETSASYELFRLLGAMLHDAKNLRQASFGSKEVIGFACDDEIGTRLFVANRGQQSATIRLPKEMIREGYATATIDCTPTKQLEQSVSLATIADVDSPNVELPQYSVTVITPKRLLTPRKKSLNSNENLFPPRPHLTFWYPPYARQQPRFDTDGIYTVDLSKVTDKPLAVIKMNIAELNLAEGKDYVIEFEAKTSANGGIVVKLPIATDSAQDKSDTSFALLHHDFTPLRYQFKYAPAANDNEISFVFTKEMVATAGKVSFRNFRITQDNRDQ